ncbi:hypothetical protein AAF712_016126, partial [Marasmius tenuissimus]
MAQAFVTTTKQECHIYYANDMKGRGRKRQQLKDLAAEAAWSVPVKEADDLGGQMPYTPSMPVFCMENIATELGISNGSPGTLVPITYDEIEGRRYAISAEADFKAYVNCDLKACHPNWVILRPIKKQIHYSLLGSTKTYYTNRSQLPLIPAFAFTSHNTQGRSLDVCCVDLASCPSIQSAYVMLLRVCSLKGLCILREFDLGQIRNHISQELKNELNRTDQKAKRTKSYSQERLSWFYNLILEGQVSLLTTDGLDFETIAASPGSFNQ